MNDIIDNVESTVREIIDNTLDPYDLDLEIYWTAGELVHNWGSLWDMGELETHFHIMINKGEREKFATIYEAVWTSMLDKELEDRYIKCAY